MNQEMNDETINNKKISVIYVISLGSCCHTASFLKKEKLKLVSYPFDWVFSGPKMIYEILIDQFKSFLDKNQYTVLTEHRSGHKVYGHRFFNHKNPKEDVDYEYYKRCVVRFYDVINSQEHKLFIITNVIDRNVRCVIAEEEIEYTNKICNYLKTICVNFSLMYINPVKLSQEEFNKLNKKFVIKQEGNLFWITMYVLSNSDGVRFRDDNDNNTYRDCIYELFDFNVKK